MRRSPLAGVALPVAEGCEIRALPAAQRFILRGEATSLAPLGAAFGIAPPARPLSSESDGERAALWLGPDEWLLVAEESAEGLEAAIDAALAGVFFSLVDVSHRQTAIELEGARAADVLNFGVALDLDERAFPVGMVARTLLLKAEITLWRRGPALWRIEVARSFAAYLVEALGAAVAALP